MDRIQLDKSFFFSSAFVTELGVNNVLFMPRSEFSMRKDSEFHTAGAAWLWMAIREKKENKEERLREA